MKTLTVQELRIGNKILDWNDSIVTVKSIEFPIALKKYFIGVNESHSRYTEEDIHPIPLTEDILLRFGFEKDDSGVEMYDNDYCEWYQKKFPIIGELCQSSDKSYLFDTETDTLRIRYVHQLQNLYQSLTGEELILK